MKSCIIIPTYNEATNIVLLIEKVLKFAPETQILVVDDNSPDGTWRVVENISIRDRRVTMLLPAMKIGLGEGYITGL